MYPLYPPKIEVLCSQKLVALFVITHAFPGQIPCIMCDVAASLVTYTIAEAYLQNLYAYNLMVHIPVLFASHADMLLLGIHMLTCLINIRWSDKHIIIY